MGATLLEYPIQTTEGNIVFNKKNGVWSYYKMDMSNLPLNDTHAFTRYIRKTVAFFEQNEYAFDFKIIPKNYDFDYFTKKVTNDLVKGEFKEEGIAYYNRANMIMKDELSLYDYEIYFGVHLNKFAYEVPNDVAGFFKVLKNRIVEDITRFYTRETNYETDFKFYKRKEEDMFQALSHYKKISKATEKDIEKIIYYQFHRNEILEEIPQKVVNLCEGVVKNHAGYLTIEHEDSTDYITIMPYVLTPYNIGSYRFILDLIEYVDFPIEFNIKFNFKSQQTNVKKIRQLKKRFRHFNDEMQQGDVDEDSVIENAHERLTLLLDETKNGKKELMYCNLTLVLFDKTKEGLERKVKEIQQFYKGTDFEIARPKVDQLSLFNSLIPASYADSNFYEQVIDTSLLATSSFDISNKIGNNFGMYLGKVVTNYELLDVTQAKNIRNNIVIFNPLITKRALRGTVHTNGNVLVTGPPGSGKSMLVKSLFTWSTFFGAKILYIDPKNEYKKFFDAAVKKYPTKEFKAMHEKMNFIELSSTGDNIGAFDPLIFLKGDEAIETASIILETLGKVDSRNKKESVTIFESIQYVMKNEVKPTLSKVLEKIKEKEPELGKFIEKYNIGYGKMLFGNDDSKTLDFERQVNILGIQGLQLPQFEKTLDEMNQAEVIGVSIMVSLSKYVNIFSTKKDEEAMIIFDEAWVLKKSKNGEALIDSMLRTGRSLETDIILITQAFDDFNANALKELIGCKFAFRPKTESSIADILEFFDMEVNDTNMELVKNLVSGVCLFQDYKGRNQVVAHEVLFDEWFEAFKTTKKDHEVVGLEESMLA
ncbi:ATP-binding protein [Bacillus cereus]|nr:ATP-binding protein [Bacillus cereus]